MSAIPQFILINYVVTQEKKGKLLLNRHYILSLQKPIQAGDGWVLCHFSPLRIEGTELFLRLDDEEGLRVWEILYGEEV